MLPAEVAKHRFTVEEFRKMGEAGIFGEDDRVELLEGKIVEMTPIGSRHAACVRRVNRVFGQRLGDRATIAVQDPVRLGSHSELQPDLALLRVRTDEYALRHPGPEDVLLLVEVADTTSRWDREHKMPVYAAAGVSEVWLLDVGAQELELFRRPEGGGYREVAVARPGDTVAPEAFPDVVLDVAEVFPPAGDV